MMMLNDEFSVATADFLTWLRHIGVEISPKASLDDLRAEGRGRGFVAIGNFEADETIFTIPRNAVWNVENALSSPGYSSLPKESGDSKLSSVVLGDMPSWLSLTTIMLSEALRDNSQWSPYLAVLPSKLDSLVFWSSSELAELQASAVLNKISRASAEEMFYQKVSNLGINGATVELFHQMASIIMAYAFDIPKNNLEPEPESDTGEELVPDNDGEETVLTMIPLADMLNADADQNNARLIYDAQSLEMRSIKAIKPGQEIYNDYGHLPRSDLLRRYGYITDSYARYDVVELCTDSIIAAFQENLVLDRKLSTVEILSKGDLNTRLDLARREAIYEDSYDISHEIADEPCLPDELLALVYILLVDSDTLKSFLQPLPHPLPSRSKMATGLVGSVVTSLLRLREQEYATSLEEDNILLKAVYSSHRRTMAIKIRQGEKMILREAIREAAAFQASNKRMRTIENKRQIPEETQNLDKRSKCK